jgi:hypothetical protein
VRRQSKFPASGLGSSGGEGVADDSTAIRA